MDMKTIEFKSIEEVMHVHEHKSGLKTFVIPKKGYSKKYTAFYTHYGSINNEFITPGEKDITKVPDGIAHFLEHKLFEQKDGSVMDKFSKIGSNPNAYTSFAQTVYLFSCTDRFSENFDLLLNFVQNPYITDESVEKEKDIIGQEIRMYQDNPSWRVFFNLLDALYHKNPVKIDIAGSIESISKINKDILYKCYNTFYHPSNMSILAVGDINPEEVFERVEQNILTSENRSSIQRIFPDEPLGINKDYIEQNLAVSMSLCQLGFKDSNFISKGVECIKREVSIKILLEMILGRSSRLYTELYSEGLINGTFDFDYSIEENYAYSALGGETNDPLKLRERIIHEIESIHKSGLNREDYDRISKAMYGKFIKQLNSIERISHAFVSVYFKEVSLFDYIDIYDKISFDYVKNVFKEHFITENHALSVIKPL